MKKLLVIGSLFIVFFLSLAPLVYAQQATLSLSPAIGTFNKGCTFTLQIALNTGSATTDGTDAILIYDPARFSATSVASGSIYPDYPGNNIDESGGKVTVSGLASVTSGYSGQGTLATINFKVLDNAQTGVSQIKFDFDPNDKAKTTDSNVVERGTVSDILNSVVNGSYTVGAGTCVAPSASPGLGRGAVGVGSTAPSAAPSTIDDAVGGETGTEALTYTMAIIGVVLTIIGVLGLTLL